MTWNVSLGGYLDAKKWAWKRGGRHQNFLQKKINRDICFKKFHLFESSWVIVLASEHERDFSHEAQNRPKGMGSKKSQWGENYESLEFEKKLCDAEEGKRRSKENSDSFLSWGVQKVFFFWMFPQLAGSIRDMWGPLLCANIKYFPSSKEVPHFFSLFLRPIDASHLPKTCPHALSRFRKRNFQRSDSIIYPDRLQKGYKLSHFKRGPQPAISRGVNVRSVCLKKGQKRIQR